MDFPFSVSLREKTSTTPSSEPKINIIFPWTLCLAIWEVQGIKDEEKENKSLTFTVTPDYFIE